MQVKSLNFNLNTNFNQVKSYIIENKENFKNKQLYNNLFIKGIGDKFLKIENNFYSWDEIKRNLDDYQEGKNIDEIIICIIYWLFNEIKIPENIYIPRKFNLEENFSNIKMEILKHKNCYKKGLITGIGENNIKITTNKAKDYYIEWDELEKIVNNIKYSSFDELE